MCGLGSITLAKSVTSITEFKLDAAAAAMLKALDHRGGHACGMMVVLADGQLGVQKAPVKAAEFETERWKVPATTRAVAVHTRMATKGKAFWNQNNHPVASSNGLAYVMHNGVAYDQHVKRRPGDPLVDTFGLAQAAAAVGKKKGNEGWVRFSERVVRACANVGGSQTLVLGFPKLPVLVTARVRSNPLVVCDVDGVQVAASTSEAVVAGILALGLKVPVEKVEWQTRRKGKSRTHSTEQQLIYALNEGDVLVWADGDHAEGWVEKFTPEHQNSYKAPSASTSVVGVAKPWATGSYAKPADAVASSKVAAGGGLVKREGLMESPWPVGTHVKTPMGREAVVETINQINATWRSYKVKVLARIDPKDLTPDPETGGTFSEMVLERWWPADKRAQEKAVVDFEAKVARAATPKPDAPKRNAGGVLEPPLQQSSNPGVPAKVSGMTGFRDRRSNRAELADFVEPMGGGVVAVEGFKTGRCEFCKEWSTTISLIDGVQACGLCAEEITSKPSDLTGRH